MIIRSRWSPVRLSAHSTYSFVWKNSPCVHFRCFHCERWHNGTLPPATIHSENTGKPKRNLYSKFPYAFCIYFGNKTKQIFDYFFYQNFLNKYLNLRIHGACSCCRSHCCQWIVNFGIFTFFDDRLVKHRCQTLHMYELFFFLAAAQANVKHPWKHFTALSIPYEYVKKNWLNHSTRSRIFAKLLPHRP